MHSASRLVVPGHAVPPLRPSRAAPTPPHLDSEHHGVQSRGEILALGQTDADIRRKITAGQLQRVGPGWFAKPGANGTATRALGVGYRITCVDALPLYGIWTPWRDDEDELHVYRARHRSSHPDWATMHAPRFATWPEKDAVASLPLALRHAVMCQSPETAAIVLESAMNTEHMTPLEVTTLLEQVPAYKRDRLGTLSAASGSGSETRVVRWLRHRGFTVEQQVYVEDAGFVDAYVGGLFVEIDGRTYHSSPEAFEEDRRRDLSLKKQGLPVLRLGYQQVWTGWKKTRRDLLRSIRELGPPGKRAVARCQR